MTRAHLVRRVAATLVSVVVPGTGLVWANRYLSGWRWCLWVRLTPLAVLVLPNLVPLYATAFAGLYVAAVVGLMLAHLVVTWRATREVATWRGRRAAVFAVISYLALVVVGLSARLWLAEFIVMPSGDMAPAVTAGERFLVPHLRADLALRRGAVVAWRDDAGVATLGRVVGLPGDAVEVREGRVAVGGIDTGAGACLGRARDCWRESLEGEAWDASLGEGAGDADGLWQVREGEAFVLCDDRACARDSRRLGPLPVKWVLGPALPVRAP